MRECILIGHRGHPEVEGTMGQYNTSHSYAMYLVETPQDVEQLAVRYPENLAFVTQTTLSVDDTVSVIDALRERFPRIQGPRKDDICYATQNRQDAVKALAGRCDVFLVVGSPNSSNSNRLREIAEKQGIPAYLIDEADEIRQEWVAEKQSVGVTAGASAPQALVDGVIDRLRAWGGEVVQESEGHRENVTFSLPRALQ
jgi:4-hydroxy-3-methylbut-2-enyl diphosphate reductase